MEIELSNEIRANIEKASRELGLNEEEINEWENTGISLCFEYQKITKK